jgi:hypothetical protein
MTVEGNQFINNKLTVVRKASFESLEQGRCHLLSSFL